MTSMAASRLQMAIRPRPGFTRNVDEAEDAKAKWKTSLVPAASGGEEECVCGKVMAAGLMQAHRPVCAVYGRDSRRKHGKPLSSTERRRIRHDGLR